MSKPRPQSWRDVIKVHPAADRFPMMSPDELKALGADIKANGFAHQIVLWTPDSDYEKWSEEERGQKFRRGEFYLLDGRNRVAALVSIGYLDGWPDRRFWYPAFDVFDPIVLGPRVDPYEYVLSSNLHRRHLTIKLPPDRLVVEIMARDQAAPGYARQVADGILDRLGVMPDIPQVLPHTPAPTPAA